MPCLVARGSVQDTRRPRGVRAVAALRVQGSAHVQGGTPAWSACRAACAALPLVVHRSRRKLAPLTLRACSRTGTLGSTSDSLSETSLAKRMLFFTSVGICGGFAGAAVGRAARKGA